jgi:hypothetical protein
VVERLQILAIEASELGGRLMEFMEQFRSRLAAPGEEDQLDPPVVWNRASFSETKSFQMVDNSGRVL